MPIDPQVVGHQLAPLDYEVNPDKIILYNLGIGAGEDPDDLKYVYENAPGLLALPTFGVIPPFPALMGLLAVPGVQINLAMLLHGEQYLEVRKPVPVQGRLVSKPRISSLYDKGKGALIELEVDTEDESGEVVFFNRFGVFIRGEGGFGGEKGPEPGNEPPERDPDATIELKTAPTQAMLYRLSGDKNPLHVDPNFSAMGGFERPILHGLCSFGFAARAVLKQYCENDPARFKAIKVRFSRHVFPGETIVTEMWKVADDQIIFRCKTAERGELCLSNSAVWLNA
jgi:acyl dehydratase